MNKRFFFQSVILCLCCIGFFPAHASILVGRITHMEGEMVKYVESETDWVAAAPDSPAGAGDVFYTYEGGKAELIMPNAMDIRIGGLTEIDIAAIETDLTEVFVNAGIARVYNNAPDGLMKLVMPYGECLIPYQGVVDFYVGDESAEIVPLNGTIDFVRTREDGSQERYEATAGSYSLLADAKSVAAGEGNVEPDWDAWCLERERMRSEQLQTRSAYLPDRLQEYAYTLENSGVWERIYYKGYYYWCWRPVYVQADWEPFTVGRWTEWHGDQIWVPYEPWGWCTHHYGYWLNIGGIWWWTPYYQGESVVQGVHVVGSGISFGSGYWPLWHPGRVAWISTDVYVGWIPLAPWEPYYGWRNWGYDSVVITATTLPTIRINVGYYAFLSWAVVIPHRYFYGSGTWRRRPHGYGSVRVKNISTTIIVKNYHGAPSFHRSVIKNYRQVSVRHKHRFVNKRLRYKPHKSVVNGINARKSARKVRPPTRAVTDRKRVRNIPTKTAVRSPAAPARARPQTVTGRIVSTRDVNKPVDRVNFGRTDLKKAQTPAGRPSGRVTGAESGRGEKQVRPRQTKEKPEGKGQVKDTPYQRKDRPRPPSQPPTQKKQVKQPSGAGQGQVQPQTRERKSGAKQRQTQPQRKKQPSGAGQGQVQPQTRERQSGETQRQTQPQRKKQPSGPGQGQVRPQAPERQPGAKQRQTQPQRKKQPSGSKQGQVRPQSSEQQPGAKQGQSQSQRLKPQGSDSQGKVQQTRQKQQSGSQQQRKNTSSNKKQAPSKKTRNSEPGNR